MPQPVVEFKDVAFSYNGTPALERVTATINRGDYVGLIGPNGAGKTTLVKILLGLLTPNNGSIKLFGQPLAQFQNWHKIGYVPQKATAFDPQFPATVREVVAMGRFALAGVGRHLGSADRERIRQTLRMVGLEELEDRPIGELSGGQQQKAFIARALVSDPELLILDEPTTGVDAKSQHEFYHFLHGLNSEHHLTLILISHDTDTVSGHVSKLLCLNRSVMDKGCSIGFIDKDDHAGHFKRVRHRH